MSGDNAGVREWLVGGAIIETPDGVLLVRNRRRNGDLDWTPPGGVIDEGEELLAGLAREVEEETGLGRHRVGGPAVRDPGRRPRARAGACGSRPGGPRPSRATCAIDDPDGIVVDARFVGVADCAWPPRRRSPVGRRAAVGMADASAGTAPDATATGSTAPSCGRWS